MSLNNTHIGAKAIGRMLEGCRSVFFIGIGGISMSSLARMTALDGFAVGGSDRGVNPQTEGLTRDGFTVYRGHDASHIEGYDAVVYTVAIGEDNPEYREAVRRGLPVISRADYLGYLMTKYRERVGVAGMHGKSTCTAMCAQILLAAGDPTVLCGAELPALGGETYRVGAAREHILFEACEYKDSFLDFSPTLAVVLNIGLDHVDYFHSMEQIRESFRKFAERSGVLLYRADDAESRLAFADCRAETHTFSAEGDAEFTARKIAHGRGTVAFDFARNGKTLGRITVPAVGLHSVCNALAAASAATILGVDFPTIADALRAFRGVHRRLEYKGKLGGAAVYDDYGHHPDEIRATLAGCREMGYERILCAFQPHTFSRLAGLFDGFAESFTDCDRVYLADVYAARELNTYGLDSSDLAKKIGSRAEYCGSLDALAKALTRDARDGDLIVVMGAGDIDGVFPLLPLR